MVVDDLNAGDRADLAFSVGARHCQMAFDVEFDRGGVEGLPVLEFHPRPELEDEHFMAVRPLPFGRQLRRNFQFGADIDELSQSAAKTMRPT
jgi:hypothetical protein